MRNQTVKEGDWVWIKPLWPGVWRVSRVLSGFRENRWSLDDPVKASTRTLIFCYRAFNDSWKRSFSFQSCEISLVQHLADEEQKQLRALFASDTKLKDAFAKYQSTHASIDLVANVSLGVMDDEITSRFPSLCDEMLSSRIAHGVTLDEVLQLLKDRDLEEHIRMIPKQRTLQLISTNHELRGSEFVYRRYRTLNQ